jgi:3-deoxy-7-phosphoheptulonate synthase
VKQTIPVGTPYKLISREYTKFFRGPADNKIIRVGEVAIGSGRPVYIAGPCAEESKAQVMKIAQGG